MRLFFFITVLFLSASVSAQPVLFVDADATGAADGSSWADAFPDLQQALATAEADDEVWVAEGTYLPTDGTDRDAAFVLVSGVGLYGGFDGTEDARDERDPEENVTVLSGDLGVEGDISDNAFHVVVASGVDEATVLDGFTVTGGNGNGANPRNRGGGIYGENSSLQVRDCRIVENRVVQTDGFGGGGGAYFGSSGAVRFERVVFARNGLDGLGGGLWLHRSFEADTSGAPPLSAVMSEVAFTGNTANFGGGGIVDRAAVSVVRARFERNVAYFAAGGLHTFNSEVHLVNVGFYGNTVPESDDLVNGAGGMWNSGSALTLTNVAFVGNTARRNGALLQGGGTSTLTNVSFVANEAEVGGGIRLTAGAAMTGRNGVFWDNTIDEIDATSGVATLRHTLIAGGCPPEGDFGEVTCESILDADPRFVRAPDPGPDETWGTADDDYGDLRLQEGSPAIDFGLTSFLPPDTFDLDRDGDTTESLPLDLAGESRVTGPAVDLGAYERPGPVAAEPVPPVSAVSFDAYPNPARGPVTVSLELDRSQRAEVVVYDLRGRRVAVITDGPLEAGRYRLRFDASNHASGVYLVRAVMTPESSGAARVFSQKLTVLR